MEYFLLLLSCITIVCGGVAPIHKHYPHADNIQPYDLSDLEAYNCNNYITAGSCVAGCVLNECYETSSVSGTTFPDAGFCAVFNFSQAIVTGVDRYSVSGRICLSSPNYPQGTGLLFNYQDRNNYEVVFKTRQDTGFCTVGYVQNGGVLETGIFDCGTTTADQWHRYTIAVYSDNTFEATLSTQGGSSTTSSRLPTHYPMSTRGGTLMLNDGSPGKVLEFDEVITTLTSADECSSSPCSPNGICIDGDASYTCNCYVGFTGLHCETNINECSSSPCGVSGTCVDGSASYTCNCYPGYTGAQCETNINECASSPCGPGGSCVDGINSYTCDCYLGYTGVFCETALGTETYFLEYATLGGFITNLTPDGTQNRMASSGGTSEQALAIDVRSRLMFYSTTGTSKGVWKAGLDDIAGTQTNIWSPTTDAYGLGLSFTDTVVFADDFSTVVMLSYDGTLIDNLSIAAKTLMSFGLAVDEIQRILYFTDVYYNKIWKVAFTSTSFVGNATVLLVGTGADQAGLNPTGLLLDGETLYWIIRESGEIRSMPVTGSTSTIVVPAAASSQYASQYLRKKGETFYYTRRVSDGGVYRVVAGGTREKITTNVTLETTGIDVY